MRLICLLSLALAACVNSQGQPTIVGQVTEASIAAGQLFCAKSTTLVVAVQTAAGPFSVVGQTASAVAAVCALIDAIPVSPPANAISVPVVTVTPPATSAPVS